MRLSDLTSNGLKAYPAKQGQILEPNKSWYLPVDVISVRMPPSSMLQEGDWIELIPCIEPSSTTVQIIDDSRLFPSQSLLVCDRNTPLYIGDSSSGFPFDALQSPHQSSHTYRFNGRDWQPLQYWTQNQSQLAIRNGEKIITSSGDFTVPAGVTQLTVSVIAAGGGGGAGGIGVSDANAADLYASGGGGGGGGAAVLNAVISVTSGQVIPITIGVKGTGGQVYRPMDGEFTSNGGNGQNAGNTTFGSWIELEGGKGGLGGKVMLNADAPAVAGGAGGRVLKNTTNGQSFNGGKGGDSAVGAVSGSLRSEDGESINSNNGGTTGNWNGHRCSWGGGGGASAHAEGGSTDSSSAFSGSQFGGGGGGRTGETYSWASNGNDYVDGGNGAIGGVIIKWSV